MDTMAARYVVYDFSNSLRDCGIRIYMAFFFSFPHSDLDLYIKDSAITADLK